MITNDLLKLISDDKLEDAVKHLQIILQNSPKLFNAIQQSGRLSDLKRIMNLGLITLQENVTVRNKIRLAIISLIQEIEETTEINDEISDELHNFEKTKKVIIQNHHGKGHNIGGDYIEGDKINI